MPLRALPTDLPVLAFSTVGQMTAFLHEYHATAPGFYLKLAKKGSNILSVTASEAVEVALCYGWIDGRANGLDDKHWLVRYTQRRPRSIWSMKNVNTIGRLIEEGRMHPAGIAAVNAAKADGRWERAYAGPATIEVSEDFEAALAAAPQAETFFEGLNRTDRYSVLWRVQTASPTTRVKRIDALVKMLADGKRPNEGATKPAPGPADLVSDVVKNHRVQSKVTKKVAHEHAATRNQADGQQRRSGLRSSRNAGSPTVLGSRNDERAADNDNGSLGLQE